MGFKNTLGVLHMHTDEIRRLLEQLENSDTISTIDLDLVLDKLRSVYDVVIELKSEVQTQYKPEEQVFISDESNENTKTVDFSHESKMPAVEKEDKKAVDTISVEPDEKKVDAKLESREDEKAKEGSLLSDRFKSEDPTLNEEIGSQTKQDDLSSQLNTNPITNLTGAIGLNEKFELINELFDGDKSKFDQTMQTLNSSGSFVEAYSYLEENFEWDMENRYVQRILELIRRKLIVRRNEQ
jgi:hypothetical protein